MRLKRASAVSPSAWRSGVTASTTHRKRKVQSPVERSKASAGLAPSVFRMAPASSHANGSRHTRNTSGLAVRCSKRCCTADRKSTRLNSSHGYISYAVFCLKKKKKKKTQQRDRHAHQQIMTTGEIRLECAHCQNLPSP